MGSESWWGIGCGFRCVCMCDVLVRAHPQLERFKREAECRRLGIPYVEEDFEANKLDESNKGFAMLQKAGEL